MGQRHQLFIVAMINGRYRTLCVIHHQWLYGHTALKRCLGTLKIFGDPANRIPLEQELIAAQRHEPSFWTATKDDYYEKNSHVPFPFIATCLITGASFGPDDGYYHGVSVEAFYMAFDEGNNNDGITIFDITDPSHVRYCFVDFHGMESERPVQLMTPLTARIYLEAYYDLSDQQYAKNLLPLLDEFNGWDTIPVAALQDTWPDGEWEKPESDGIGGDEVVAPGLKKLIVSNPDTSKSLRDGAMVTVIQALLDGSDEDSGLISEAELLTDFLPKLKSKLYEHASSLKPSSHQQDLLYKALEYDTDVDLSPFKGFSAEDLSFLVSRLRNHSRMTTLCISNRPDLTGEDLRVVLRDAAGLKALYILEDPQVSAQGMGTFLNDCDLYHSDLLRQPIKPQPERSFTDIDSRSSDDVMPADQVCRENDVSQLVWIGITDEQALDESHRLKSGAFDWQTLRQEKGRNSYGWSGPDLRYKRYPLDIPLPTFKTVAGLLRLLKWGSFSELFNVEDFSGGAAFSFAMASSIPGGKESGLGSVYGGNGFGIGPLGTTLYLDCTPDRIPPNDAHEHLDPGRWAIVLIHEAIGALSQKYLDKHQRGKYAGDSDSEDGSSPKQPKREEQSLGGMKNQDQPFRAIKRLRYALVTPSTASNASDHDFIVADIPTFLEHTMGKSQGKGNGGESQKMVEAWNSQIATIDTVDFYGDDDIHEILPKVFPGQKSFSSGS